MYDSVVIIIKGVKYILTHNTNAMIISMLPDIIDYNQDIEAWNEALLAYDSEIYEYVEHNLDEKK